MQLIEIFKAGKRTDANGVEVEITTADLQQAVDAYNINFHESPAVIGHPKHNAPAYGWVKRLELDGDLRRWSKKVASRKFLPLSILPTARTILARVTCIYAMSAF